MLATVVKIESRSFSSDEIRHFRTENTRSDYKLENTCDLYVVYRYKHKPVVEKDRDSIFTTILLMSY
jgi:hypothetical protein